MNRLDLPETVGVICGIIVAFVVVFMPIVTNGFALRHRSINGRCALAVMFTMGGTLVGGVAAKLTLMTTGNHFMLFIPAAFAMVCYAIGTILAIIGLREIRRRRGRYRGGKRRAVSMLVLNAFHAALFAGAAYVWFAGWPVFSRSGGAGKEVRSEEWNFRLEPPREWMLIEGAKGGPQTRATFVRRKPEMHLNVLAEQSPGAKPAALAAAVEEVKTQLASAGGKLIGEEALAVNGCSGHRIESEGLSGAVRFFFVHWIFPHNGTLYQVVASGSPEDRDFIRAESTKLLTGFHLLDPKRAAKPAETTRDDSEFHSEPYGYTVNLRGTPWTRRWETLAKDNPFAEFGVQNANATAAFVVIPVALGEVELESAVLTRALAARVGVPFPHPAVAGLKDWTQGPLEGQAFSFERTTKETSFVFRVRALTGRGYAYLLAAWADKRGLASPDFLDQALDRVSFSAKAPVLPHDLEPRTDRDRLAQSLVCNDIGLSLDNAGTPNLALPWFLRSVKFSPREASFLMNAVETWLKVGRPADALALIERSAANFPNDQKMAAARARVLLLTGDSAGAEKSIDALIKAGWRDDAQFGEYTRTLCQRGLTSEALAAIDRYSRGTDSPILQRMRALVFQTRKDTDKAIAILREARKTAPDDQTTLALAETYSTAERHSDAVVEYARILAAHPDSAPVLQRKGTSEFALRRYRDAKASFELALQKDPASAEIKRILDHVTRLLAEGESLSAKKPIEPVAIPAGLLAETPVAGTADSSAAYRRIVHAIEFVKGGEFKSTEHGTIAVRDDLGVGKFSTLDFRFDPASEEIFVNSLIVKNAKGEPAGTARGEDSYVVRDGTGGAVLQVPVPGLLPGFALEYIVTRREIAAPAEFPFYSHAFYRTVPVSRSIFFVRSPADSLKWEASPGVPEPKRAEGGLVWTVDATPVPSTELFPALPDTFLPTLSLGSSTAAWPAVAKAYLAELKDRLPIDADVRAAASTAVAELGSAAEKTAALARFVQRELTFKPGEFSQRARIPNPAAKILRDKSGDAKDHAFLLVQMLESASIPARLALVNSGATVRPGVPSLDQFNHVIVFVPAGESGSFIDCTVKTGNVRKSPPSGLAGSRALILDAEQPRLATIPEHAADASSIRVKRDITFPNETDADVRESAVFDGASAQSLRNSLLSAEPAQRNASVQQALLREVAGAVLTSVRIEGIDDPQIPLKIETRYLLRGRFKQAGGRFMGRLPVFWESLFLRADPLEKRATPFRLLVPIQIESTATLTPPAGLISTAPTIRPVENAFDRATGAAHLDANKLMIEVRIARRAGQFPAAQYRAFTDSAAASIGIIEQNVVLQKPGARD